MTMRFVIKPHEVRAGVEMVEVWVGDQFVGAIYPGSNDNELRFVSKYLTSAGFFSMSPPAAQMLLSLEGSRR